jgi:hypothetical protein
MEPDDGQNDHDTPDQPNYLASRVLGVGELWSSTTVGGPMAIDITLVLGDQPGELARVGEVLGRAGVNIEGLCAVTSGGGRAEVHVLVEDLEAALPALSRTAWPSAPSRKCWLSPWKTGPAPSAR